MVPIITYNNKKELVLKVKVVMKLDCHTKKEWRYPVCLLSNKNSTEKENSPSMFIK